MKHHDLMFKFPRRAGMSMLAFIIRLSLINSSSKFFFFGFYSDSYPRKFSKFLFMSEIRTYSISVSDDALQQLQQRLAWAKLPSQLEPGLQEDHWDFGVPVSEIRRLVNYWKNGFDWRKAESQLNELPQYQTKIDVEGFGALDIHCEEIDLNPVSRHYNSHGTMMWQSFIKAGFVYRGHKASPLLKGNDSEPAFTVVAPDLPNFGFSQGVQKRGFGLGQYAEVLNKLMLKLGYAQYVTQGGDWGFWITRCLGLLLPDHCKASHMNMVEATAPTFTSSPFLAVKHAIMPYSDHEKKRQERRAWFRQEGSGYNKLQSTKPQTIGFGLSDSPVTLLAWIYEKLHDWTDSYPWTDDEILTWISIYWFSVAGPEASVRIYYECHHPESVGGIYHPRLMEYIPHVKFGFAHLPREINTVPRVWASTLGEVVLQSEHAAGGHFAAWEVPSVLAADLSTMFRPGGPCFGLVASRSGLEPRSGLGLNGDS
ncbi:hypothetical protein N7468_004024 [Penicillium chermesinum]|uniref:Epoxide hydrolase n=1 Tax=Penicillium chermesinum TaxID=63820 RepID=A0A9W9P7Q4_9EURO|nr:uncharacterized protein N7468_004024 [Penicillium chermesinum]KAJ5239405.1 hypothetical protein N7468_004024 [Penicillium chermesinum]